MARNMYGATSADFTITSGGRVIPGAVLTLWDARTGGTQITDLLDVNSAACTTITSDAAGAVVYYGPNNDKTVHWADSGQGARVAIRPVDITGETGATPALTIGTVDTGTAAATLTGTDEDPVLNLTIPPAANDSITSAMIAADAVGSSEIAANAVGSTELADNAVDTAAIADGAVTSGKVAASTFAAFGTVGNLLTANQASGTDTLGTTVGFAASFCTIASDAAAAISGTKGLLVTSTGTSNFGPWIPTYTGGAGFPVIPGKTYTAAVSVKAPVITRTFVLYIYWFKSDGTASATAFTQAGGVTLTPSAREVRWSAVAPADAATATLRLSAFAPAGAGEVYHADVFGFWEGAGGTWAMPGTPIVGQSRIAVNNAVDLSGTGTPESVITAAPGSTWLQTDSTTDVKGWIKWVKATGTGTTGWVAGPEADTGRRNVVADIDADWAVNASAGYIRLQRVGERVYFEARLDRVTASGGRGGFDATYTAPSGFAPRNAYNIRGLANGPGGVAGFVGDLSSPGRMDVWFPSGGTWAAGDDVFFTAEWYTNDAWPASLPGSAI